MTGENKYCGLYRDVLFRVFNFNKVKRLAEWIQNKNMAIKKERRGNTPSETIRNGKNSETKKEQNSKNADCGFTGRFAKRFSAKLRFALVFRSAFQFVLRRVLVWRSEATPLVYDKHTP